VAVRKIMRMGHPVLRKVAQPVSSHELGSDWLRHLVTDMTETLQDYGGIGLAAPQIGESVRVAIIEIEGGLTRYGDLPALPLTAFVNPEIEIISDSTAGYWEGCLSVPGLRGFVERPQHVRVDYWDLTGTQCALELTGFLATVFQHEFDHLDGRLYVDRLSDSTLLSFEDEYVRYLMPREEEEVENSV
jgi:peptide deformylase